jgi:hypothetical protein
MIRNGGEAIITMLHLAMVRMKVCQLREWSPK